MSNGKFISNKKARSEKYRYLLQEIVCEDKFLDRFDNSSSIYNWLNPYKYDEDLLQYKDELYTRIIELMKENLTEKQYNYFYDYYILLMTCTEIAKKYGTNQSSITKSRIGNQDYNIGGSKTKRYGGSIKKLQKIVKEDEICQELLKKISEQEEKW